MTYTPNGGLPDKHYYSNVVSRTFSWVDHDIPVAGQALTLTGFDYTAGTGVYYEDIPCNGKAVTVTVGSPGCNHANSFDYL